MLQGFEFPGVARIPRRDLLAVAGSLGGIVLLAWWYLFSVASSMSSDMAMPPEAGMTAMSAMDTMATPSWTPVYFLLMYLMWSVMMIGMMLPAVAPTVMIYMMVARKAATENRPVAATGCFVSGYVLVWIGFSLVATLSQYMLDQLAMLSPMMAANNRILGGALLLAAGAWQFTPLKDQCLHQCRSPVQFISGHWRNGKAGALQMGVYHGLFCLGCCWAIMTLLFVGGVMNLLWIALLSFFVLVEKVLPMGRQSGKVTGAIMLVAGVGFVLSAWR